MLGSVSFCPNTGIAIRKIFNNVSLLQSLPCSFACEYLICNVRRSKRVNIKCGKLSI